MGNQLNSIMHGVSRSTHKELIKAKVRAKDLLVGVGRVVTEPRLSQYRFGPGANPNLRPANVDLSTGMASVSATPRPANVDLSTPSVSAGLQFTLVDIQHMIYAFAEQMQEKLQESLESLPVGYLQERLNNIVKAVNRFLSAADGNALALNWKEYAEPMLEIRQQCSVLLGSLSGTKKDQTYDDILQFCLEIFGRPGGWRPNGSDDSQRELKAHLNKLTRLPTPPEGQHTTWRPGEQRLAEQRLAERPTDDETTRAKSEQLR